MQKKYAQNYKTFNGLSYKALLAEITIFILLNIVIKSEKVLSQIVVIKL